MIVLVLEQCGFLRRIAETRVRAYDVPKGESIMLEAIDPDCPHRIDRHRQLPRSGGRKTDVQRIQLNVTAEREEDEHGQRKDREQRNVNVHDEPSIVI